MKSTNFIRAFPKKCSPHDAIQSINDPFRQFIDWHKVREGKVESIKLVSHPKKEDDLSKLLIFHSSSRSMVSDIVSGFSRNEEPALSKWREDNQPNLQFIYEAKHMDFLLPKFEQIKELVWNLIVRPDAHLKGRRITLATSILLHEIIIYHLRTASLKYH